MWEATANPPVHTWCKRRSDENVLVFFIVYFVWRQNWQQAVDTLKNLVRQPYPRITMMIDVETWQGQIIGNQSDGSNNAYRAIADWPDPEPSQRRRPPH